MILPVSRRPRQHAKMEFSQFDLGVVEAISPVERRLMGRAALLARNVDWDRRTIAMRSGMRRVCENSPGAVQLSTFEPAETWTPSGLSASADTTNFVLREVSGVGTQGRHLLLTGPTPPTATGSIARTGLTLDLSGRAEDVFSIWVYPTIVPAGYKLQLAFQTSVGNEYLGTLAESSTASTLTQEIPRYCRLKRSRFAAVGAPDWSTITAIRIVLTMPEGATFDVTVDNLTKCPGNGQGLFCFRRVTDAVYKGSQDVYAVLDGHLYRQDKPNECWIDMGLLFDLYADVNAAAMNDRLYIFDGVSANRKVMPDGSTVYLMGIGAVTSPVAASPVATGGALQTGTHRFIVTYYSTITGIESGPHNREGQEVVVVGPNGSIGYSGIPASTDPQVTHVRIYRKSPFMTQFQRVSTDPDGEMVNGIGTFTDTLADSALGAELDLDLDAPGPFRLLAPFPGLGVMLGVFAATPTALNFSNPNSGATVENWPVANVVAAGRDDNEEFTALYFDGYRVQMHRRNAILAAYQVQAPILIEVRPLASAPGAAGQKSLAEVEGRIYYAAQDGIRALGVLGEPEKVMPLAQPLWNRTIDPSGVDRACAVYNRRRGQYRLYFRSYGMAQNDLCWNLHAKGPLDRVLGAAGASASGIDEQSAVAAAKVLVGGEEREWILAADGQVYQIDTGGSDDGLAIEMRHRTTWLSPAGGGYLYRFPYLDVEMEQTGSGLLDAKVWYDFSNRAPSGTPQALMMSDDAAPLGTFVLGTSRLGADYGNQRRLRLPVQRARRVMLEFRYRGVGSVNIYAMRLWHSLVGK